MGVLAALGEDAPFVIQMKAALLKKELTAEQVREIPAFLAHYVGFPRAVTPVPGGGGGGGARIARAHAVARRRTGGIEETVMRVGFIGLGNMGDPQARAIANGGFELVVYDAWPADARVIPRAGAAGRLASRNSPRRLTCCASACATTRRCGR